MLEQQLGVVHDEVERLQKQRDQLKNKVTVMMIKTLTWCLVFLPDLCS